MVDRRTLGKAVLAGLLAKVLGREEAEAGEIVVRDNVVINEPCEAIADPWKRDLCLWKEAKRENREAFVRQAALESARFDKVYLRSWGWYVQDGERSGLRPGRCIGSGACGAASRCRPGVRGASAGTAR